MVNTQYTQYTLNNNEQQHKTIDGQPKNIYLNIDFLVLMLNNTFKKAC